MARRGSSGVVACLSVLVPVAVATAVAPPAAAATVVVVTTTADLVDASDGLVSLREAIDLANASPAPTNVVLEPAAIYDLTRCDGDSVRGDEGLNVVDDLDLTTVLPVTVLGNGATVHNTCPARRVMETVSERLTLDHLTLSGGWAYHGAALLVTGGLTLSHAIVEHNGPSVWDGSFHAFAVQIDPGPPSPANQEVLISDSIIGPSKWAGGLADDAVVGSISITNSQVLDNHRPDSMNGAAGISVTHRALTLTASVVARNNSSELAHPPPLWPDDLPPVPVNEFRYGFVAGASGGVFVGDTAAVIDRVLFEDNQGWAGALAAQGTVTRSIFRDNVGSYVGAAKGDQGSTLLTIVDSYFERNRATVAGAVTGADVHRSTFVDNRGGLAGVMAILHVSPHVVTSSTFVGNVGRESGAVLVRDADVGPSTDEYLFSDSTFVGNVALGGEANPSAHDLLALREGTEVGVRLERTVLGSSGGGLPSCLVGPEVLTSPISSGGNNFVSEGQCFSVVDPTDIVDGGDPMLGPVGDHGGLTPTVVPWAGSPLLDRVPASDPACGGSGSTDQRGAPRLVGPACDIGAVEGSGEAVPRPAWFHPLAPSRVLDSRPGSQVGGFGSPWGAGTVRDVVVGGAGGVPVDADAVVVNVTVTGGSAASFLSVWPAGELQPLVSSLNWVAGQTVANAVTVKLGVGGAISVFNPSGSVDVIVDVNGYYDDGPGSGFTALPPARVLDSRPGSQVGGFGSPWGAGTVRDVVVGGAGGVPADADAVVVNVTVTGGSAASFLSVWPAGEPQPLVSSLNWVAGKTVANAVTVKLGIAGAISVFNPSGTVDVIIDVAGYFEAGAGKAFRPLRPVRILDSRPVSQVGPFGSPWSVGTVRDMSVAGGGVPVDAEAVVVNATVTSTSAASFLTIWPAGQPRPLVSSLNWVAGQTVPNAVTAQLSAGVLSVFNPTGTVDVIIDVNGYYG